MKKVVAVVLIVGALVLNGCGNKTIIDTKWNFTQAVVKVGDTYEEITVKSWNDYEDGIVQVVSTDGKVYLTHYNNVVLIGN